MQKTRATAQNLCARAFVPVTVDSRFILDCFLAKTAFCKTFESILRDDSLGAKSSDVSQDSPSCPSLRIIPS